MLQTLSCTIIDRLGLARDILKKEKSLKLCQPLEEFLIKCDSIMIMLLEQDYGVYGDMSLIGGLLEAFLLLSNKGLS